MTFWLALLLICVGATVMLLLPILRPKNSVTDSENLDLEFYRDQLKSLEVQQLSSTVDTETLEAEKDEIARRMLRASRQAKSGASANNEFRGSSKLAALGVFVFVPAFSVLLYLNLGSPHIADVPLSAQRNMNADDQNIGQLVARAEDHLKSNPDDVRGWEVLARVYGSLGRHNDRAHALGQLIRLQGENATRLTDLAEALTVMAENVVSERAKALFERALSIAPNHRKARFYLALALQQESKFEDSLALWRGLAREAPGDQNWQSVIQQQIARTQTLAGITPDSGLSGPTNEDVEAASEMSQEDRMLMIQGMVSGLAEKLAEEPDNLPGWQRLIRSYTVLGKKAEALKAIADANAQFAGNADALARLEATRQSLGL